MLKSCRRDAPRSWMPRTSQMKTNNKTRAETAALLRHPFSPVPTTSIPSWSDAATSQPGCEHICPKFRTRRRHHQAHTAPRSRTFPGHGESPVVPRLGCIVATRISRVMLVEMGTLLNHMGRRSACNSEPCGNGASTCYRGTQGQTK